MQQFACLLLNGGDDVRMAVPESVDGESAEEIEILLAFGIPEIGSFAFDESEVSVAVGIDDVFCRHGFDFSGCHENFSFGTGRSRR